jgi:hypothetical protein
LYCDCVVNGKPSRHFDKRADAYRLAAQRHYVCVVRLQGKTKMSVSIMNHLSSIKKQNTGLKRDSSTPPEDWVYFCDCRYWKKGGFCEHAYAAGHCCGFLDLRLLVRPLSDVLSSAPRHRLAKSQGRRFRQPEVTSRNIRLSEVCKTIVVQPVYHHYRHTWRMKLHRRASSTPVT